MARNHRNFIDVTLAVAKLGAHALYLNTMFSGPQLEGVMEREEPGRAGLRRRSSRELLSEADADTGVKRFVAWNDGDVTDTTID